MNPKDKFGSTIFNYKFKELKKMEAILIHNGYMESKSKSNLFYKRHMLGRFYADMRGTKEVPIWEDTRPLFYWQFKPEVPMWKRRRAIKQELTGLFHVGCPCRLAYDFQMNCEEFKNTSTSVGEDGTYVWDDGYCEFCGKDFGGDSSFCSKECELKYFDSLKKPCLACGEKMQLFEGIRHHISYFPERIIFVHSKCHNKIHKTNLFPELKPDIDEINRFYSKIKKSE